MVKIEELGFGLMRTGVPTEAPAAWGARAIYTGRKVDLLWDRQDLKAVDDVTKKTFVEKLNGGAIKKFCKWAEGKFSDSDDVHVFEADGVKFFCSTNSSYGYLYVSAVPV